MFKLIRIKSFFGVVATLAIVISQFTWLFLLPPTIKAANVTSQVNSAGDDVNEVSNSLESSTSTIWVGNGNSSTASYTGLRFNNLNIPQGSQITSAVIELRAASTQWQSISYQLAAENSGNSIAFSNSSRPSQRSLTTAKVNHSSNTQWVANTWYQTSDLSAMVQEVVNREDWGVGNSMAFIFYGTGSSWGRKFVSSYEAGSTLAPRLLVTYSSTPTPTATPTVTPTPSPIPTPSPTPSPTISPTPTPSPTSSTFFSLGAGFNDVITRQLVRASDDNIYTFAGGVNQPVVHVYWSTTTGLPVSNTDFGSITQITTGNPISVETAYDGANIIHVLVNSTNGQIIDYPFDISTKTFKTSSVLFTDSASTPPDIGTAGLSAMVDTTGNLHITYRNNSNHIIHRALTYNSSLNTLSPVSDAFQVDTTGSANHPSVAVSPLDNSLTVSWVSQSSSPAKINVRSRDVNGNWDSVATVSTSAVWVSNNSGLNIDQGPSIVITSNGNKHLVYMQDYETTPSGTDYGRIHYVRNNGSGWVDQSLPVFTHDPAVATNGVDVFAIGHGHPFNTSCKSMDDMCYVARDTTTGNWGNPILVAHPTNGSFDASPSIKWGVVGFNRPEELEFLFFQTPYQNPILYYARVSTTISAIPTPTSTPTPPPGTYTVEYLVPSNDRDAWSGNANTGNLNHEVRVNGYNNTNEKYAFVSNDSDEESSAAEFQVDIPKGSTINNAFITVKAVDFENPSPTGAMDIHMYDVDSAFPFQDGFFGDLVNHHPTNAQKVSWPAGTTGWTQGALVNTPSVASLVQTFINRTNYAPGNYIGFVVTEGTIASGRYYGWEDYGAGTPAKLTVNYTIGATPTPTPTPTVTPSPTPTPSSTPNPDFVNETLITNLNEPTAIEFLPDGRMIILERGGKIHIAQAGASTVDPTPFMQITNINITSGERGLTGVALDPDFENNGYIYLFYTRNSPLRDTVSRFTVTGNTADINSESIIWQDNVNAPLWHHGGSVAFGTDGKLYITIGDGFDRSAEVQTLTSYRGKLLRVNADGSIPQDNPFWDGAGSNLDAIYALGLRNPFRFSVDEQTGRIYIGDVGGNDQNNSDEEINIVSSGANYGWPICEGQEGRPSGGTCVTPTSPGTYTSPFFTYPHAGRDASVTGGFIYRNGNFPNEYDGDYFFGDYVQNWVRGLNIDATTGALISSYNFLPADGSKDGPYGEIVDLAQGPDGAIYYADIGISWEGVSNPGTIRRIKYTGVNAPAVINTAEADNVSSPTAPFTVNFTGDATDPENEDLVYSWNFGDGSSIEESRNPSHTYLNKGQYTARLTVSDGSNQTISNPISITIGNAPVIDSLTVVSPSDQPGGNITFRAGDSVSYSAVASDEDSTLDESNYSWDVHLIHLSHTHPEAGPVNASSGQFDVPVNGHEINDEISFQFVLTVTDEDGLSTTEAVTIYPEIVNLSFNSVPSGVEILLDGISYTTPVSTFSTVVGFEHQISTPSQIQLGGKTYNFASWSDSGAAAHTIVTPETNTTYTANYNEAVSNIVGTVFLDANSNGVKDASELGYQGATISLSGGSSETAVSAANGTYSFANKSLLNYTVTIIVPSGYDATSSTSVNFTLDNDDEVVNFGILQRTALVSLTSQISSSTDDVNQVNNSLDNSSTLWLGNANGTSRTALRFTNMTIPQGATITNAYLEVYSVQGQWQNMAFSIRGENAANSATFTTSSLPSTRPLTIAVVNHNSNTNWAANTWYQLNDISSIVQEIVNRGDWQSGNSMSIIMQGTGGNWARKFIRSYNANGSQAPRLVVEYQ